MEVLNLNNSDLDNLKTYLLDDSIWHSESTIYIDPTNITRLLKIYNACYDRNWMIEKLKSVKNLIRFKSEYDIPELLKPVGYVYVDNDFKGIVLPIIQGKNASIYLNSENVSISLKIEILKQIATILEKIKETNSGACFADVHSDNFLIDGIEEKRNVRAIGIDTESMKLYNSQGTTNFYLFDNDNISNSKKYSFNSIGLVLPDYNTDIFCLIMMILECLSYEHLFYTISKEEYKRYLDYLSSLGIDNNLLIAFSSIYQDNIDNINPLPYLDSLKNINKDTSIYTFRMKYNRN